MAEMANVGLARSPTLIVATGCDKTEDLRVPGVIDIIVDEGGRMYATLTREMVLCGGYRCLSGCLDHQGKAHVRIDGSAQPFLCGMLANRRSRDFFATSRHRISLWTVPGAWTSGIARS